MVSAFVSVAKMPFKSTYPGSSQALSWSTAKLIKSNSCSLFSFGHAELVFDSAEELGIAHLLLSSLGKSGLCLCGRTWTQGCQSTNHMGFPNDAVPEPTYLLLLLWKQRPSVIKFFLLEDEKRETSFQLKIK